MNEKKAKQVRRLAKKKLKKDLETGLTSYIRSLQSGSLPGRIKYALIIIFKINWKVNK